MKKKVIRIIADILYVILISPLLIASIRIGYQKFFEPDKIPDIFGYKMFVVLSEEIEEPLKYGDLAITYNKIDDISTNSIIAYRNKADEVTISSKNVNMEKFEGVLVSRIPNLGSILYYISQPMWIIIISCVIVATGGVWIYFAKRIDLKESQQ